MDWGIISNIVSIIIAICAGALSIIFYRWSDKSNKEISDNTNKITDKIGQLDRLYDKMFDSVFAIVKEDNDAMRKHIFESREKGATSQNNVEPKIETSDNQIKSNIPAEQNMVNTSVDE